MCGTQFQQKPSEGSAADTERQRASPTSRPARPHPARRRRKLGAVQINREEPVDTQGTSSPGTYREVAERARVRYLVSN